MTRTTAIAPAASSAPAAPTGGARPAGWGRGCGILAGVAMICAGMVSAQPLDVPSGQDVTLNEVLVDNKLGNTGETWVRFRFLAPRIGAGVGQVGYDVSALDMDHLCSAFALPYLVDNGLSAARVVISLSDREIAFGESDPGVTQFFEAYRPESTGCIWEEF